MHRRYLVFAINGTLYDARRATSAGLAACLDYLTHKLGALPPHLSATYLEALHRHVERERRSDMTSSDHCLRESFHRALMTLHESRAWWADDLLRVFAEHCRDPKFLYPDVLSTLNVLNRQFDMGVLSNSDCDLRKIGLDHLFAFRLRTRELPWRKPDPHLYAIFQRWNGSGADGFVFIGSDPKNDVDGPRRHRFSAVWLNRNNERFPAGLKLPDMTIHSLDQLIGEVECSMLSPSN